MLVLLVDTYAFSIFLHSMGLFVHLYFETGDFRYLKVLSEW